jgi:hypothetical protein
MKKSILTAIFCVFGFAASFAQFEEGKLYLGTSFDGAGLSYSETTKLALGVGANAGYMFSHDWLAIGEAGFNYRNKDLQELYVGAKCRYFIEQNGLFLQGGVKYLHRVGGYNDLQITPEVGYCYFLNKNLTVEPSVYYDMSLSDFSDKSRFGIKIGLGVYF